MNVKITSSEASEEQKNLWYKERNQSPEGDWRKMHDVADPEPGRLVRALALAGQRYVGAMEILQGSRLTDHAEAANRSAASAQEAYTQAVAAALADPIARAFLEGTE